MRGWQTRSCTSQVARTVDVPLWPPCFEHFFGSCFGKQVCWHSRLQGSPKLAPIELESGACPKLCSRNHTKVLVDPSMCNLMTIIVEEQLFWDITTTSGYAHVVTTIHVNKRRSSVGRAPFLTEQTDFESLLLWRPRIDGTHFQQNYGPKTWSAKPKIFPQNPHWQCANKIQAMQAHECCPRNTFEEHFLSPCSKVSKPRPTNQRSNHAQQLPNHVEMEECGEVGTTLDL